MNSGRQDWTGGGLMGMAQLQIYGSQAAEPNLVSGDAVADFLADDGLYGLADARDVGVCSPPWTGGPPWTPVLSRAGGRGTLAGATDAAPGRRRPIQARRQCGGGRMLEQLQMTLSPEIQVPAEGLQLTGRPGHQSPGQLHPAARVVGAGHLLVPVGEHLFPEADELGVDADPVTGVVGQLGSAVLTGEQAIHGRVPEAVRPRLGPT